MPEPQRIDNPLVRLLERLHEAKTKKKAAEAAVHEIEPEVVDLFHQEGLTTVTLQGTRFGKLTGTLVESTTVTVDEAKLKKSIGATAYKKLTKPVLDKGLLEDAMARGVVDPNTVSACSIEKPRKPYVLVNTDTAKTSVPVVRSSRKRRDIANQIRGRMK